MRTVLNFASCPLVRQFQGRELLRVSDEPQISALSRLFCLRILASRANGTGGAARAVTGRFSR